MQEDELELDFSKSMNFLGKLKGVLPVYDWGYSKMSVVLSEEDR